MLISVVIPSYKRNQVLCDTVEYLLSLKYKPLEIIIVDQSPNHDPNTEDFLKSLHSKNQINWIKKKKPSITKSMNEGALQAKGEIVLFLDDDIIPSQNLILSHEQAHKQSGDIMAVVGQILQPEDHGQCKVFTSINTEMKLSLKTDLDFPFNSNLRKEVANVMAGNLSVKREAFIKIGGFDERFSPPVSFRFETEFARRVIKNKGKIFFEGLASIKHLRAPSGGTRSSGSHMKSLSPVHGVGDYYYALLHGKGLDKYLYILKRPFREIRTKFHMKNPWYIPVKFIGELRAIFMAYKKIRQGPKLLDKSLYKDPANDA